MRTPRTKSFYISAIFGIALLLAAIPFAPYAGFFLHVWWDEHTESSDTPRPSKPLRLIHNHGSRSDTAPRDIAPTPTAVNAANAQDEVLEPDPPSRYFDDGRPDPLSGRETAFERWTLDNAELWDEMDPQLQECTYMSYVNAFGRSPEAGIDWCLAQAERADAETMDE